PQVAGAHQKNTITEAEFLQQLFRVLSQTFELIIGHTRVYEFYQFDLVELMEAIQAANVFAIRSGFTPKAGRVSAILDGKTLLREYLIPVNVRYRNFGRGYKI